MPAGPLDPDRLAATEFATAFRGYDTGEVRALLVAVAEALREATAREDELREQLARAEHHLREVRDTAVADAERAAEEGRRQGREMVAEAQRVRERMLGDLARRRRHARQQVEQLMAGRERLLETFDSARQIIESATHDLRTSLPEARQAAEAAGRRFDQGDEEEAEEAVAALEGEIEAARIAGLPIVEPADDERDIDRAGDGGDGTNDRGELSLLGERDVREMPPVELGAEFEEVRIVPLDEVAPTPGATDDTASVTDDEIDDVAAEADDVAAEAEDVAAEAEDVAAEGDAPVDDGLAGDDESGDDGPSAHGSAEAHEPAADPERLDDLFATLRAARADAVDDAKTVLAGGDTDPVVGIEVAADGADVAPADAVEPTSDGVDADRDRDGDRGGDVDPGHDPLALLDALDVDRVLVATTDQLASALKRVLADEQNELLERLRGLRKDQSATDATLLGDEVALAGRFAAAAVDPLAEVAAIAMASTTPGPRARPPATAPMGDEVAAGLVGPLHERLRRGLADAGTDGDEAASHVRATFREWKTQRIAAQSADAARSAFHAGLLAGVAKGHTLQWVLDDAESACAECADNSLAGSVQRGAAYPTGHRHPPAHDGCRCLLRPSAEDQQG